MSKDILAFVCSALHERPFTLPRSPVLFGLMIGLDGVCEPLYAIRGRYPKLSKTSSEAFDEAMGQGESYLSKIELQHILEAHREPSEREAHDVLAELVKQNVDFTLAFAFS